MAWNSGNIKKVGIDEIKKILQQAFIASASGGAATTQALENELSRLGYELSFFGESCDVIHLYGMFGYEVKRSQNIVCGEKNPIALADMAEKLHQMFLESKGGDGKSLLTNLFERGKEILKEIGSKNPTTTLNQYRFLNRFATYFGREYSIINEGEDIYLELVAGGANKKITQPIEQPKIKYPELGTLNAAQEKLNNHNKEIKRIYNKSVHLQQSEEKIQAIKETFLQQFWDKYSKTKQPIKLSEIELEEQDRNLLLKHIENIQFLTFDKKNGEIQPRNSFILNTFYKIFKEKNPLLIPAPVIGGRYYGANKDQNLKTYFGFQCQQKTFLQIFDDIFMQRMGQAYVLRPFFEERAKLLEYFWVALDQDSMSADLTKIAAHIKKRGVSGSDLMREYGDIACSFLRLEGLVVYLDTEKLKEEISQNAPEGEKLEKLDINTIQKISIDALSVEEYFGTQAIHLLEIIKINKEAKKIQKQQPLQKAIKQNTQTYQIGSKLLTLNDILEINIKLRTFIIENIENKKIVDSVGYVSAEVLKRECFKGDSRITTSQDIVNITELIKQTPAWAEGHRYGWKIDDDNKMYLRLSNVLFFILELKEKERKFPFEWLFHLLKKNELADKLMEENWDKDGSPNGMLSKYVREYFDYAIYGGYLRYDTESLANAKMIIFNTGLITNKYQDMFFIFKRKSTDMFFSIKHFADDVHLPDGFRAKDIRPIKFFSNLSDAILETRLVEIGKTDYDHILRERLERFPKEIQEMYSGRDIDFENRLRQEIELSLAKCRRDYKFAVPQIYFGEIGFLLPIYFNEQKDKTKPAVLLAITKVRIRGKKGVQEEHYYKIRTALTPEMAYANARIIAKPDSSWL